VGATKNDKIRESILIEGMHKMVSLNPPVCDFGWKAPNFNLPGVDGKNWTLKDIAGPKGTLVMFICNHCPYVKAIRERLVADVRELKALGINAIAIQSNDVVNYPDDSFERMKEVAAEFDFPFPYVLDENQEVAKAYDAICTPDFFGFNAKLELQYRGRFDESRKETVSNSTRDLFNAMKQIAETGLGPKEQIASIGCSIKWKEAA
jgi:peroxiredoxin